MTSCEVMRFAPFSTNGRSASASRLACARTSGQSIWAVLNCAFAPPVSLFTFGLPASRKPETGCAVSRCSVCDFAAA